MLWNEEVARGDPPVFLKLNARQVRRLGQDQRSTQFGHSAAQNGK